MDPGFRQSGDTYAGQGCDSAALTVSLREAMSRLGITIVGTNFSHSKSEYSWAQYITIRRVNSHGSVKVFSCDGWVAFTNSFGARIECQVPLHSSLSPDPIRLAQLHFVDLAARKIG